MFNNQKKIKILYWLLIMCFLSCQYQKVQKLPASENQQEFNAFIESLENEFIYYDEKKAIIDCIKQEYGQHVDTLSHPYYKVLFYETILNELYDSHISLNTNTKESWRLSSPIHVEANKEGVFIKNVFSSQIDYSFSENIIDAEIQAFNGIDFQKVIDDFPSSCHNKKDAQVKEWLANKILAGKRNEPRIVHLKLQNGNQIDLDIDQLTLKEESSLLSAHTHDNIGVIRINNSLGNSDLVKAFDKALDGLMNTEALILDLRNTFNGGNTGVAEPIMGRFITKKIGYQDYGNKNKKHTKYVSPRKQVYDKPLYVLAGRWTGSMGEGMTIGLEGIDRATVVGTELNRLAGGMKTINLLKSKFGFNVSFEKMYHINGSLREQYVPSNYVKQETVSEDAFTKHAMKLIRQD